MSQKIWKKEIIKTEKINMKEGQTKETNENTGKRGRRISLKN